MKIQSRVVGIGIALVVAATAVAAVQTDRSPLPRTIPTVQARPTTTAPDTRRVTIKVAGMSCASCEATVRTMLTRSPGVISAQVNVEKGIAVVTYSANRTTPTKLADVINRLGYKATLPRA